MRRTWTQGPVLMAVIIKGCYSAALATSTSLVQIKLTNARAVHHFAVRFRPAGRAEERAEQKWTFL